MKSKDIRAMFLDHFRSQQHTVVDSASLVPSNDPTLFFTNAGMVQFKDVFTGQEKRSYSRATSVQRCLRVSGKHNDLEEVGRTPRHHTLFEMLGNFSFGNYFKREAIQLAWSLLTKRFELDPERLWITVYKDDDEAFDLWREVAGVPEHRIQRLGEKDNFWSMGETGPCGPCTEIHYDHGPEYGDDPNGPAGETDRYVEIWNLVFMQYDRDIEGTLHPLPNPSIDTGMGLERLAAIKQGVYNNYDTDVFQPIIQACANWAGVQYGKDISTDTSLRVIADHARAIAFLIADGVMPANEGRGYVLRRIARRAIRYGVKLGLQQPFIHKAADIVISEMESAYPHLTDQRSFVLEVLETEEVRFRETLDKGLQILEYSLAQLKGNAPLGGDVVFQLHDTFGFPMDLTRLIAQERNIVIDETGYAERMAEQRAAGRANWKGSGQDHLNTEHKELSALFHTEFTGYTSVEGTSVVQALLNKEGLRVEALTEGTGFVVLNKTPFYAESGGQVGDLGEISGTRGRLQVTDTQKPTGSLFLHHVTVTEGIVQVGDAVQCSINATRRLLIRRNHTATHLLHSALRAVLGAHVTQKGSLVEENRLRFDFSHHKPVTPEELQRIEALVQDQIGQNTALHVDNCSMEDAKSRGALALFGEKYGDEVRVVSIPGFSTELCGGTHVDSTGEIGIFTIISESGISAGVRRIEALTSNGALTWFKSRNQISLNAAKALRTRVEELPTVINRLVNERKELEKEVQKLRKDLARATAGDLSETAKNINGIFVVSAEFNGDFDGLRAEADRIRNKLGTAVVVLGSRQKGVKLIAAVTKDIAGKKVHAGNLIREIAKIVGGGGGGRPDMAQAGGKNAEALPKALERVFDVIQTTA